MMKCICNRVSLLEALTAAASVALTRTPKPILECVRLTAEADGLTLTAYDQEVGLRYQTRQVEVTEPGEALVHTGRLVSVVRESSDETMTLEVMDESLHVRGRDSHFQIVGKDPREFPPVAGPEGDPQWVLKVGELKSAVEKTLFAAARESTRYAINGVLWQKTDNRVRLVATDGRRLAMSHASLEKAAGDDVEAIVPGKALGLLSRLHFDADESMDVRITSNQIFLRTESVTISSVLVEGNFPKWEDVVPRDNELVLTIGSETLLSAVRRASLLANVESKGIRMSLKGSTLTLSSRSADQGEAEVRVEEVDYKGADMEIGFNPEFLIDALKVCDETVAFSFKDSGKPALMKSGTDFQYVVMPVNLS